MPQQFDDAYLDGLYRQHVSTGLPAPAWHTRLMRLLRDQMQLTVSQRQRDNWQIILFYAAQRGKTIQDDDERNVLSTAIQESLAWLAHLPADEPDAQA